MKKLEYYIIFILAFALMLLASCRTTKAVETERHEAVVHSLDYQDSLHSEFTLTFDTLIWMAPQPPKGEAMQTGMTMSRSIADALPPRGLGGLRIINGVLTNNDNKVRKRCEVDSISSKAQEVIHPVRVPPKLNPNLIFLLIIAVILLFLITRCRTR